MSERLDHFLVSQNIGSRKEVSALVRKGRVLVNGKPVGDAAYKIDPNCDAVWVDGKEVIYRKHLYIMMNKPAGVLSATEDKNGTTVLELLPPRLQRRGLFPAGRLDKDTRGLLLITDDGDLAHRMLSPKSHVYKLYEAETEKPVTESDCRAFAQGVQCGTLLCAPARLCMKQGESGKNIAQVEIREGKFHQVKRMFEACGNKVISLKRLKIGGLSLDETLQDGEARLLSEDEVRQIFQ